MVLSIEFLEIGSRKKHDGRKGLPRKITLIEGDRPPGSHIYLTYIRRCLGVAWGTGRSFIVQKPGAAFMT